MTTTLNPLHFEDLDPHRFEDLVRQIVYDFRDWALLEPTGRLGSDEGYDARGFERVRAEVEVEDSERDEDDESGSLEVTDERLWQIQCKREKSISPKKITGYIEEMIPKTATVPYGVIFAAPADFSKATRDIFRELLRKQGVRELYLWGKADLEDMLFQPKNDHLLYAYFGISLQIQRRSQKNKLRGVLATKRKVIRHLGPVNEFNEKDILIRDIDDNQYPYSRGVPNFRKRPAWKKYTFIGHEHDGIRILLRKMFAYRDVEYGPPAGDPILKAWDFTDKFNFKPEDDWNDDPDAPDYHSQVLKVWQGFDETKRGYFEAIGLVKYENIVEIDPEGDIYAQCPHVYVRKVHDQGFFEKYVYYRLIGTNRWARDVYLPAKADKLRVKMFPDQFPDPSETELKGPDFEKPPDNK